MKVKMKMFLSQNHSWRFVGENIAKALIKRGHELHLQSTNGYETFAEELKPFIKEKFDPTYDMQISYTALKNFGQYFQNGSKNRFGIWNYETTVLPPGFAKYHKFVDKVCPASQFAADIFTNNGIPKDKVVVLPHGINVGEFSTKEVYQLKTKKNTKILSNIAQPHIRKNIPGMFKAFGKAFTKDDDVCLVCKISTKKRAKPVENKRIKGKSKKKVKPIKNTSRDTSRDSQKAMGFDVDFWSEYNKFVKEFPNHAEVEIITDFLPSMAPLYNAVDIVFAMTYAECFWLPGLEGFATNNLVISPNYGGQLCYQNENNSLLIDGKIIRAPKEMQYWAPSPYAAMFEPSIDHAVELLQKAVKEYDVLMKRFNPNINEQLNRLTWENVAIQLEEMCV